MTSFENQVAETSEWIDSPRFDGIIRLYGARQVVEQRGTIPNDYPITRQAAEGFYNRLRELFEQRESITTFGPYSPGQAVAMRRLGLEGIYLGGWATSAKGSAQEDPGPDLASYPLSQVPNEAAVLVRALLTADRNQQYLRSQMSDAEREATPQIDYRPFIIADADTGHGGDGHVRNLVRRFVEVGVPGYHIEDQRPGTKKCGHQGGKVLVSCDEQIKRLNAARFQLDVMGVSGIIVARTDAEAATLLDGRGDERDHPFVLGSTNVSLPPYKICLLGLLRAVNNAGLDDVKGHQLYAIPESEYEAADAWLGRIGLADEIKTRVAAHDKRGSTGPLVDSLIDRLVSAWEAQAGLNTFAAAVAEVMEFRQREGATFAMTVEEWRAYASDLSMRSAKTKANELGINLIWDCEHCKTPDGFYQIRGGIPYAIAKSLAAAPFCDILWMETKTANLAEAKIFADAIHAQFPGKMMAYNLSPSFNWDTTGMTDEEMRQFPTELGKLGFVFNFITYGGHQIDGVAADDFTVALKQDGMLALALLQRKIRLIESPYKTPQTLVGGPRLDGALGASSGRTATTRAMGKDSTQHQHLILTEVPTSLLEEWLAGWAEHNGIADSLKVRLRPHRAGSELLELGVLNNDGDTVANVIFASIQDRRGRTILSVRDQNTFAETYRQKRLMTLLHLFLVHRYKVDSIHYVAPTDDNRHQTAGMKKLGIFSKVNDEVGQIIVADIASDTVSAYLDGGSALRELIAKQR